MIFFCFRLVAKQSGTSGVIGINFLAPLATNTGLPFPYIRTWILFREYESIFNELEQAESDEISRITGCRKPCRYRRYSFLGEPSPSAFESEHYIFALWAVSNKTKVETEELIYPSSSLVADFGGTLSLFLGFSFISLWDKLGALQRFLWTQNWSEISLEYIVSLFSLSIHVYYCGAYNQHKLRKKLCVSKFWWKSERREFSFP